MASSPYQKLSVSEKNALNRSRVRELEVDCPNGCGMRIMPADLLVHMKERCDGQLEPGPAAKWVTWREALMMGVSHSTLSFWAKSGQVRFMGERQDRKYLLRDLAMKIAQRCGFRRR